MKYQPRSKTTQLAMIAATLAAMAPGTHIICPAPRPDEDDEFTPLRNAMRKTAPRPQPPPPAPIVSKMGTLQPDGTYLTRQQRRAAQRARKR